MVDGSAPEHFGLQLDHMVHYPVLEPFLLVWSHSLPIRIFAISRNILWRLHRIRQSLRRRFDFFKLFSGVRLVVSFTDWSSDVLEVFGWFVYWGWESYCFCLVGVVVLLASYLEIWVCGLTQISIGQRSRIKPYRSRLADESGMRSTQLAWLQNRAIQLWEEMHA